MAAAFPVSTSSDLAGPAPGNIMIARHSSERHPSPVMRRSVSGHQRSRFLRLPPDCRFAIAEVRPGHNVTRVSPDRGWAPRIWMTNPGWSDPDCTAFHAGEGGRGARDGARAKSGLSFVDGRLQAMADPGWLPPPPARNESRARPRRRSRSGHGKSLIRPHPEQVALRSEYPASIASPTERVRQ